MAIIDSLKSKKLPIGVFAGLTAGPKPARIFITMDYDENLQYLSAINGFKVKIYEAGANPKGSIQFEIPVTPPTVEIDFGNSKDTENVARTGEVALPKYSKAEQIRWESFFPYDTSAPYLNSSVRTAFGNVKNSISSLKNDILNIAKQEATPKIYIDIFKQLSKSEKPVTISMTFYDGGNLPANDYTIETFKTSPESNGDYNYNISFIEYTDIKPKLLNNNGEEISTDNIKVPDKVLFKSIKTASEFFTFAKQCYGTVSKKLVWAFANYNGIRNLVFNTVLVGWRIKGIFKDMGGRFGILNNIIGVSKITSKDTQAITESLKKISYSKANQAMAELFEQYKKI